MQKGIDVMREEVAVTRIRERARRVALLRWMWRQVWRVKRTARAVLRAVTRAPQKLWELAWYWRWFPAEFIGLRLMRWKYGHLYETREENPLVSIIIPTLDRGKLLVERTLPSIFAQSYQNFEVVIVGDDSPDDTVEWISQIKDPRVRFYNLPKPGRYPKDARKRWSVAGTTPDNRSRDLAHGEWIAPMDDDDVFAPDHIESLLRFAQHGEHEWVAADFLEERTPGSLVLASGSPEDSQSKRLARLMSRSVRSSWFYRSYLRCIKADLHAWRYKLNGDQSLKRRYVRVGVRMGYLDHVVTYKLVRPGERFLYTGEAIDAVNSDPK